ncbi:DsbA family protein [Bernardetia sp.]|uniref:DsbA family protein n=1 Tax=Bernardetia sp. TaxID=1937974 RepID=UPI0025BC4149|nr:DsbA family protein [Bernardetia sp.]
MKIIYIYDALCGWCYGFAPTMRTFFDKHKSEFESIEVVSGGMITGNRIGAIGEVAPYIKTAYKDVENRTGVTFGEKFLKDILEEGSSIFTSIPPSIALSVFKKEVEKNTALAGEKNEKTLHFAEDLQSLIYFDGIEPKDYSKYGELAEKYGLDKSDFVKKMNSPEYEKLAQQDFQLSQDFGVNGFPTVIIQKEEEYYLFARGFVDLETLEKRFESMKTSV